MNTCKNCNEPINGNFCANCGQPTNVKKIDKNYLIQEVKEFFSGNKGLIYTVKKVAVNPGESVRQFIAEDRYRFVKPITFLFIASLVYAIVSSLFNISTADFFEQADDAYESSIGTFISTWIFENPGYSNLIVGLFMAFWMKLFFRKAGYNLFEIFILLCFVTGIMTLLSTIGIAVRGLTNFNILYLMLIEITYLTWAVGQFFDKKKVSSYVKAFLAYSCGFLVMMILIVIITAVEVAIRH